MLNLEMSYRILGVGFFGITGILASASVARAPAWQILSLLGKLMDGGQERGRGKRNGGEMGKRRGGERRGEGVRRGEERKGIGNTCSGLTAGLPPLCLIQTTAHNKDGSWAKNGVRQSAKVMIHG